MTNQKQTYQRFTVAQRIEHWVLTISFTILVITGLPQRYALAPWAAFTIKILGGIEFTRILHRIAAGVLAFAAIYHIVAVAYKLFVLRVPLTMLPGIKDATDLLDVVRYNLGLTDKHPQLPRYTFAEKLEYWALIWGTLVMGITGFILWNPIAAARVLPGEFIPASKAAHSAEALLATVAILIWHFYWVHLKTFNKSMFTGKLTQEQMKEEHAAELERIEKGQTFSPPPYEVRRKRERIFIPIAAVLSLVVAVGLIAFLTFEDTALTTVPPAEQEEAYVTAVPSPTTTPAPTPIPTETPPPTPTSETPTEEPTPEPEEDVAGLAPFIAHPIEGQEECLVCHAADAMSPYPEDHVDFPLSTCTVCHVLESEERSEPMSVQHELEGRADCLLCHATDLLPESHQDADFTNEACLLCHTPMEGAGDEGEGTSTEEETSEDAISYSNDLLPIFEEGCASCHGEGALGGLNMMEYEAFTAGGDSGPAFVPGSPDESLVVQKMEEDHPAVLEGDNLQLLIDWIAAGAENN